MRKHRKKTSYYTRLDICAGVLHRHCCARRHWHDLLYDVHCRTEGERARCIYGSKSEHIDGECWTRGALTISSIWQSFCGRGIRHEALWQCRRYTIAQKLVYLCPAHRRQKCNPALDEVVFAGSPATPCYALKCRGPSRSLRAARSYTSAARLRTTSFSYLPVRGKTPLLHLYIPSSCGHQRHCG